MLNRFGHWIGVTFLKWTMEFLYFTCRVEIVEGAEIVKDVRDRKRPIICLFWHNRIFIVSPFIRNNWFNRGVYFTVLISASNDGEMIANVVERWGASVARGSTSRGGREALTILTKTLVKKKNSIIITPDGPRGPLYEFQPGAIFASQLTQSELIPICVAPTKFWRLNSWDGFLMPKPFAKIYVSIGEPEIIPRELDEAGREERRLQQQAKMAEQVVRLDKMAGIPEYAGKKVRPAKG